MTDKTTPQADTADLDALFEARREMPVDAPSAALVARIMADAATEGAPATVPSVAPSTTPAPSAATGFSALWAALGGWFGAGGLAAATLTGLWVGIAQPAALDAINDALLGQSQTLDVFSSTDPFESEG